MECGKNIDDLNFQQNCDTTVIVTGASGSIGSAATKMLIDKGFSVIMACRNLVKGEEVREKIMKERPDADVQLLQLDLASFRSIENFAEEIENLEVRPKYLHNNAGIICRDFCTTEDGFEMTFGTNYIGTVYLTKLLMPIMGGGFHVVNTVSLTRYISDVNHDVFDVNEKKFRQLRTYGISKYALMLYSLKLSQMVPEGCHVNMTDPGVVNSNMITMHRWFDPLADVLFRPFFCSTPEQGAIPACNALISKDNGMFFRKDRCKKLPQRFHDHKLMDWLWDETNAIIEKTQKK